MLKNFWYALAFGHEVTDDKPFKIRCLGMDLALYRKADGSVAAMSDLCVHRGGSLGDGWVKDDCLVCPYHGWKYDGDGACIEIPANRDGVPIPRKARVDAYPVVERYGFVWVFLGDLPEAERPPLPDWSYAEDPAFRPVYGEFLWNANYERVLENGCDFAHAPFVHSTTFGNIDKPQVPDYDVEVGEWSAGATVTLEPPEPKGAWGALLQVRKLLGQTPPKRDGVVTSNGWHMPNLLRLEVNIPIGKMVIYDVNIPIDEDHTLTKWVMLRNFMTGSWADSNSIARTHKIFVQDQRTVEGQRPELLPYDLSAELHVKSDALQLAFRRKRQQCIEAGWSIDTHRYPLNGPRKEATVIPSPARREIPELENAWVMKEVPVAIGNRPLTPATDGPIETVGAPNSSQED